MHVKGDGDGLLLHCTTGLAVSRCTGSGDASENNKPSVPSHCVRELQLGNFVIRYKDITLLNCIGEGRLIPILCNNMSVILFQLWSVLGEFGIVYKARLARSVQEVAVKTLKGLPRES